MEKAVWKAAVNREVNNCVYNWTSDRITGRFATANEVKSVTSHEVINTNGIILCKDMNKAFVDFVIRDYSKPMGVATYKTSKDMSDEIKKALPDIDDLKKLLDTDEERG